jgi:hypothetical protein
MLEYQTEPTPHIGPMQQEPLEACRRTRVSKPR